MGCFRLKINNTRVFEDRLRDQQSKIIHSMVNDPIRAISNNDRKS